MHFERLIRVCIECRGCGTIRRTIPASLLQPYISECPVCKGSGRGTV